MQEIKDERENARLPPPREARLTASCIAANVTSCIVRSLHRSSAPQVRQQPRAAAQQIGDVLSEQLPHFRPHLRSPGPTPRLAGPAEVSQRPPASRRQRPAVALSAPAAATQHAVGRRAERQLRFRDRSATAGAVIKDGAIPQFANSTISNRAMRGPLSTRLLIPRRSPRASAACPALHQTAAGCGS